MSQIEYFPTIYMKGLSETMYSIGGKYRGIYLKYMEAKSMNNDMHNQKLCSHLNELIDIELGKTNPDMNLIEECSALLDILEKIVPANRGPGLAPVVSRGLQESRGSKGGNRNPP